MATGVSRTKWEHIPTTHISEGGRGNGSDISLAYQGKRPEPEILAAEPANVTRLWESEGRGVANTNRLYFGENLGVLSLLLRDHSVKGKVRLVYIDPPFATKSVFQSRSLANAYCDLLVGAHYVEFLRERLVHLRELLAEDGSIYVHLDENMAFQVKLVMDEVFGSRNFRNWITRKKCNPKNYTRKTYGNVSDFILFYTKSEGYVWNRPVKEWTPDSATREYQYVEESTGRRYKKVPIHAPGVRNGETGKPWRGMKPPPGKHWQFPPDTLEEMDARGEIYWSPNGNPRRKVYLDESAGIPLQDIWLDVRDAHNQNIHISGYPTEKNPELLARIIEASSNPGDLVLDCFSGSGTSLAVASEKGRKWIGVDSSPEAVAVTLKRFSVGLERMGDFVTRKAAAHAGNHGEGYLPFGRSSEPERDAKTSRKTHIVRDFALYAACPYAGELDGVVEAWKKNMTPGKQTHSRQ